MRRGFVLTVGLVACLSVIPRPAPAGERGAKLLGYNATSYIEHVRFLASDELEGRRPGTPGYDRAADYVAAKFLEYGLRPGGRDGSYFQSFEIRGDKSFDKAAAALTISSIARELRPGVDWTPFAFSKPGDMEGGLAFAGYCISAGEHQYDDFLEFDAKGKVLLAFRHEPRSADPKATFGGTDPSAHALFVRKVNTAADKGAIGLIIVNPPSRSPEADELEKWSRMQSSMSYRLPIIQITRAVAEEIFKAAQMPDLATLENDLNLHRESASGDLLGVRVSVKTGVAQPDLHTNNVLGVLPGDGASDEFIVVGAHLDHVGNVPRWDSRTEAPEVHNGADDNASGTAGLLELARVMSASTRGKRSTLFIAFSGEEMGLLGSEHYVTNPTVELEKIRTMINFDMIGRLSMGKLDIWGIPSAIEFEDIVRRAAEPVGVKYGAPSNKADLFGRSDHASFHKKDIPVLFPCTNTHKQYHKPDDDTELVDAEGAVRIVQMTHTILSELTSMDDGPTFVADKLATSPTSAPAPDSQPSAASAPAGAPGDATAGAPAERDDKSPAMPGVRMGISPNYSDKEAGVLVDSVSEGGSAEKGGIRPADRIVEIDKRAIDTIYTYMDVLQRYKPGDEIEVVVLRGGQRTPLKVTLQGRSRPQ